MVRLQPYLRPFVRLLLVGPWLLCTMLVGAGSALAVPNPAWPAQCPQRLAIVLDISTSMESNLGQVKDSAADLVDSLRGSANQVSVVTFGSVANVTIPLTDVGDDENRSALKDRVDAVELLLGNEGGTNWEAAFSAAAQLSPSIVVFITDGQPTARGVAVPTGADGDAANLDAAVQVADAMRTAGVRIVGIGIGLLPNYLPNLVEVTGPTVNDDYYETGATADGLLDKLYDIASKACGIPVAALPQPEGRDLPVLAIIGGVIAAALLAVVAGYLLSRHRSSVTPSLMPQKSGAIANPTIGWDEIPAAAASVTSREPPQSDSAAEPPEPPPPERDPQGQGHISRPPRRISTARHLGTTSQRHADKIDRP